ncbi:hypothetical protein CS369_22120 [Candidatus Symbiopectobacterium sp. 'North America']|uniref:hypothetical protein n=1 Tax=Candidatus Symbiopectobacterium sp. 'North America' TaxID=2794574 RepID=UPI0018CB2378|nr:hypothetical protein [Candidatus Symbiopectobacterium sp. 'North America']MBG6246729.1 hypothetical protein [Candidatus Symbiopectobacterium sp. 'North America']
MAKVVITITDKARGIDVQCQIEPENGDSGLAQTVAIAVGAGLAGHVNEKVLKAIHSANIKRGKTHVH